MGSTYFTTGTSGFTGSNNCSPTAGTNICLYWTRRNSAFSNLLPTGGWANVHNTLYSLMNTDVNGGTYDSNFRSGLIAYMKQRLSKQTPSSSYRNYANTVSEFDTHIRGEIVNGRPVNLHLKDDEYYSNGDGGHSVVGFGYARYRYGSTWSSHYVMIDDGWVSSPNRYIHYQTGRDHMNVSKINPY